MRLWHQALIPYLDNQHLLGQHSECCALRGKGWGRKHATVDYVFTHPFTRLYEYHMLVMDEMKKRGYYANPDWMSVNFHRTNLELIKDDITLMRKEIDDIILMRKFNFKLIFYPEHDNEYLRECIDLLKQRNAPMDFDKIEKELGVK